MFFHKLTLGDLATNCYFLADEKTGDAIMIDAPDEHELIERFLEEKGYTLRKILLTHAHFDHILALSYIKEHTGAEICLHEDEADVLGDEELNHLFFHGKTYSPSRPKPDVLLKDGDTVTVGEIFIKVIHTPGHTKGGASYLAGDLLFSGDTLFRHSIGRTDLPTGDYKSEIKAIKEKLLPLGDDIKVYPGHGAATTIGEERKENPYLI